VDEQTTRPALRPFDMLLASGLRCNYTLITDSIAPESKYYLGFSSNHGPLDETRKCRNAYGVGYRNGTVSQGSPLWRPSLGFGLLPRWGSSRDHKVQEFKGGGEGAEFAVCAQRRTNQAPDPIGLNPCHQPKQGLRKHQKVGKIIRSDTRPNNRDKKENA